MDTYDLELHTLNGVVKVECEKHEDKLIYREPTEEMKKHPKYLKLLEIYGEG